MLSCCRTALGMQGQVRNESVICEVMRLWMVYYGCMVSVKQGLSESGSVACQRSSVVEQQFRKLQVVGSIPTVGSSYTAISVFS